MYNVRSIYSFLFSTSFLALSITAADLDTTKQQDLNKRLHIATQTGDEAATRQVILEGAQVKVPARENGSLPLSNAAYEGHLIVAQLLVENGAAVNQMDKSLGSTPFQMAVHRGHEGLVTYFATKGADLDMPTETGKTPIQLAESKFDFDMVNLLKKLKDKRS